MNKRLKDYIEGLFKNAPDNEHARECKEEILLNSEEKFNDLIKSGMSEDEAYRAVVAGIGDVDELFAALKEEPSRESARGADAPPLIVNEAQDHIEKKKRRGLSTVAIVLIAVGGALLLIFALSLAGILIARTLPGVDAAVEMGKEIGENAKEFAEDISGRAEEFADDVSERAEAIGGHGSARGENDASYDGDEFGSVREVSIDWAAGAVSILPSDNGTLYMTESGSFAQDEALKYRIINSKKLEIYFVDNTLPSLLNGNLKKELQVYIPTEAEGLYSVEVNSASAKVSITGLSLRELDVTSASGGIELSDISSDEADVYTASGTINISGFETRSIEAGNVSGKTSFGGLFDQGDFHTTSGAVYIECASAPKELDVESVSAEITVILPEDSSFSLDTESISGRLYSEFDLSSHGGTDTFGSSPEKCEMDFETVSGNMNICKS